jgi:chemotaxis protein CheD
LSTPEIPPEIVSVPIGRWEVVAAPKQIRTLLGSCAGVVLLDKAAKLGGVAHIVLPDSRGETGQPGKYADTAIPGMIADFERRLGRSSRGRLTAKIVGGASMFQAGPAINIGKMNQAAVDMILAGLGIPVLARDVGGGSGRRLTLDVASGIVTIRVPGGEDYVI